MRVSRFVDVAAALALASTLAAGCARSPAARRARLPRGGPVLARIGDLTITEGDFLARVEESGPSARLRASNPEGRKQTLEGMIQAELLYAEARRRHLRRDASVRARVNPLLVKRLLAKEFEPRVKIEHVTQDEIRRLYEQRHDEFHMPEMWRVGLILHRDRASAEETVREVIAFGRDDDRFEALAASPRNLDEKLRKSEGNVGYAPLDRLLAQLDPPLASAAARLVRDDQPGPEIIEMPSGFYVMLRTGHRAAIARSVDEVREGLRQQAYRERRDRELERYAAELRKRFRVRVHERRVPWVQGVLDVPPPARP